MRRRDPHSVPVDSPAARAVAHVAAQARGGPMPADLRVNMHFHPDRLFHGEPILTVMARDGIYRCQFETGTSNGGLTAHPGGDRWKWESSIFGGAYDAAQAHERPKYGALNHRRRMIGASPRFGSAYIRLAAHTLERTTFCYPDSVYEPRDFGVASRLALIPLADAFTGDPLDDYIEAQVHGPLRFAEDVEALVLDPCFRGTEIEQLARLLPCVIEWHDGFRAEIAAIVANPSYRGQEFVDQALQLAQGGWLTAREIGDASRAGGHDPQALKRVWHYVARFGAPP